MRTNNIYRVQLAKYAYICVEADSEEETMHIAEAFTDEIDDDIFEDSDVSVHACDVGAEEVDESTYDADTIYTADGAMDRDDYLEAWEEQKELDEEEEAKEPWQRGGWDMTNQTSLNFD